MIPVLSAHDLILIREVITTCLAGEGEQDRGHRVAGQGLVWTQVGARVMLGSWAVPRG